jgi:hypothetical protein
MNGREVQCTLDFGAGYVKAKGHPKYLGIKWKVTVKWILNRMGWRELYSSGSG